MSAAFGVMIDDNRRLRAMSRAAQIGPTSFKRVVQTTMQ